MAKERSVFREKSYDFSDCSVIIYFVISNFFHNMFLIIAYICLSFEILMYRMTLNVLSNPCRLCVNAEWIIYQNDR